MVIIMYEYQYMVPNKPLDANLESIVWNGEYPMRNG